MFLFGIFDGSERQPIVDVAQVVLPSQTTSFQIVVLSSRGLAGPSQIAAEQIIDGNDVGRHLLKAADAAAVLYILGVVLPSPVQVEKVNYAAGRDDGYVGYAVLTAYHPYGSRAAIRLHGAAFQGLAFHSDRSNLWIFA